MWRRSVSPSASARLAPVRRGRSLGSVAAAAPRPCSRRSGGPKRSSISGPVRRGRAPPGPGLPLALTARRMPRRSHQTSNSSSNRSQSVLEQQSRARRPRRSSCGRREVDRAQQAERVAGLAEADREAIVPQQPDEARGPPGEPAAGVAGRRRHQATFAIRRAITSGASACWSSWVLSRQSRLSCTASGAACQILDLEAEQRRGPVQGLGDARDLAQVLAPDRLDHAHDLLGERRRDPGHAREHDPELLVLARVVDEVVEAAPPERVRELARPVRGQHHPGDRARGDRAELGHADLKVGQHFQQIGLELLVGAVDLVDQQHRRHRPG